METIKILTDLGLTEDEASIYKALLESGFLPARQIARKTQIGRTLVYRNLINLEKFGLVERKDLEKAVTLFYPSHPSKLKDLIEKKESAVFLAKNSLSQVLNKLTSDYNALVGRPNVKFYEGMNGIQELYDDVLEKGENYLLIRSYLDKKTEALKSMVENHIEKQVKKNIKVRALTPFVDTTAKGIRSGESEAHLVSRCIIPEKFDIPAQVIIYGDKVGIVSLKSSIMTTIIENEDISETFKILFDKIWELSLSESQKIKEKINLRHLN